ncbi:MAG: hypothetical protein EA339_14985 [Rhodobacteraceae bacterium]|nr:MAG: hypothetical protein EA339_14985 [Paracoccaceae bacterium]
MNEAVRLPLPAPRAESAEPVLAHNGAPVTVALGLTLLPDKTAALESAGFTGLAQALGLPSDPDLVQLDLDRPGLRGRLSAGRVQLCDTSLRASLRAGDGAARALLAHELTHLAQTRAPGRVLPRARLALAETEALDAGRRAAEGRVLHRPRARIAPDTTLHDTSLADLVQTEFATEIARIKRLLRGWLGFLWVTDGAVREMFTLVEAEPLEIQQAVFSALTPDERATLVDNVSPGHFARFRSVILAAFSVTEPEVIIGSGADLFEGMEFSGLTPQEIACLGTIFDMGLTEATLTALRRHPVQGTHVAELLDTDLRERARELYNPATAGTAARDALADRRQARAAAIMAARDDAGGLATITALHALLEDPDDAARLEALDRLAGLMGRPQIFEGVVHNLQPPRHRTDLLDRLLRGLPVRALREANDRGAAGGVQFTRIETLLRVASLRRPADNVLLAEALLSEFWIFNTISAEEAFLAWHLIKTLPDAMRAALLAENGDAIAQKISGALSAEMREELGMNFYRGGEGRTDLASIQAQLLDDALWRVATAGRLRGLIRMAVAAGEGEWVFLRSREVHDLDPERYMDPDFVAAIVTPLMLFNSERPDGTRRVSWSPEATSWQYNGFGSGIAGAFEAFGDLISLLYHSREGAALVGNVMFGRSVGGQGIDGVSLQNLMGGSIMGFRLAEGTDPSLSQERRDALVAARAAERGVNYIDRAYWDRRRGVLELEARALDLARVRYAMGDLLFAAEGGMVETLAMSLNIGTREGHRPTNMVLSIGRLDLTDTLLIQRDAMTAINRIEVTGLNIRLGREALSGEMRAADTGARVGAVLTAPFSWLLRPLGFMVTMGGRVEEITDGLTTPQVPSPLVVSFDTLKLTGLTMSSGQHVAEASLENVRLGIAGTVDDYLKILFESMDANVGQKVRLMVAAQRLPDGPQRAALETRVADLAQRVAALTDLSRQILDARAVVAQLGALDDLLPADQARLAAAQEVLAPYAQGGMTLDAGALVVTGLSGAINGHLPTLTDLHGRGAGSAGLLAFLIDSEALGRIVQGPAHRNATAPALRRDPAEFRLDLPDFTLEEVTIRGAIPKLSDTQAALERARAALEERSWDPQLVAAKAAAQERLAATERYLELARAGVTHLPRAEADELARLRTQLLASEAVYLHHLQVEGAQLGFSAEAGSLILAAQAFQATGDPAQSGAQGAAIRAGAFSLGSAEGRNVTLSLGVADGLRGFADLEARLARVGLSGAQLSVTDLLHQDMALSADRVGAEGFEIALDTRAGRLDAQAATLGVDGLHGRASRAWVDAQIAAAMAKPVDQRTATDTAAIAALREALDVIDGFERLLARLDAEIGLAEGDARARLVAQRADVISLYLLWEKRFAARSGVVEDLAVRITGLGPLGESGFDMGAARDRGVTIEGTGGADGRRLLRRLSLSDARFGATEAGQIEADEMSGRFMVSNTHIAIDRLTIERLFLDRFVMTSREDVPAAEHGGIRISQIYSNGATTATGIAVTADLHFEQTAEDPTQYRMIRAELGQFRIERLEAGYLGFASTHNAPDPLAPDAQGRYQSSIFEIDGGALLGIDASGLSIAFPPGERAAPVLLGQVQLDQIDNVRGLAMMEDVLDFGSAQLTGAHLSIAFVENGGQIIELGHAVELADGRRAREGGLRLSAGTARMPQGEVDFASGMITGRIERQGDETRLVGVGIASAQLSRFHFRAGAREIFSARPLNLRGITVDASVDTGEEGNPRLQIETLRVREIDGEDITIRDGSREIVIRQDPQLVQDAILLGTPLPPPLQIVGLAVRNLAWSARGGVAAGGQSDAGTIGLASAHAAFGLIEDDMNLGVLVDAAGLELAFLRDGTQQLDLADLDARVAGQINDSLTVDVSVRDLAVQGAVRTRDRIIVPNLTIPTITLDRLLFTSEQMRIDVPETGGRVVLTGTTAHVEFALDPDNAAQPVGAVEIHGLEVPTTTMRGITLTLYKALGDPAQGTTPRDLIVRAPETETVIMSNLRLQPQPAETAFRITPDPSNPESWLPTGLVQIDTITGDDLALDITGMLNATADLQLSGLTFDFLAAQGMAFSLQGLTATNIIGTAGEAGEHVFDLTEAGAAGFGAPNAGIGLNVLSRNRDGTVTLDSGVLSGLTYEMPDKGIKLHIESASLPGAGGARAVTFTPVAGRLNIPELIVTEARIEIADVRALVSGENDPNAPQQNLDFLRALNGTLNFDVNYAPLHFTESIMVRVTNGAVNFDQILSTVSAGEYIVFDVQGDRLVVQLNYGKLIGQLRRNPFYGRNPAYRLGVFAWEELDATERERAGTNREATLETLGRRLPESDSDSDDSASGPSDPPPVSLRNIVGDFTLAQTPIDLGAAGSIVVNGGSPGRAIDLDFTGDLINNPTAANSQLTFAIGTVGIEVGPNGPLTFGGVTAETAALHLTGFHDVQLFFQAFTPERLTAGVRGARLTNLNLSGL